MEQRLRPESDPALVERGRNPHDALRRIASGCGACASVAGMAGLAAWALGYGDRTSLIRGLPAMKPNTALMAALSGAALVLQIPLEGRRGAVRAAQGFAAGVAALAGLTLTTLALGLPGIPFSSQAAPQTAVAFLLLAAALFFFDRRTPRGRRWASGLSVLAGSIAGVAFLGVLFKVGLLNSAPRSHPEIGMALPTMAILWALSLGTLLSRPEVGFMAVATSPDLGGMAVRRLLAGLAFFAPVAILLALGARRQWYDPSLGAALVAFLGLANGAAVVVSTGGQLSRSIAARRRSEQMARDLFDQASDALFIADLDGRYTDVNPAGCRMLGRTREEILGLTILDLIPPEEAPRLLQSKEKLLQGDIHVSEWRLRRGDGTFLPVEVSAKILPDGRWQGFVRDISDRKRAEEERQRERFRLAMDAAAGAMLVVGQDGRITLANTEAERLFGWEPGTLAGQPVEALVPERFRPSHVMLRKRFFRDSVARRPMAEGRSVTAVRKDGSEFPVEISLTRIEEGGNAFAVAAITDVTRRRQAEAALRESEQRFRLLVQGTRDYAIFMHDAEGRIAVWNEGAERILGYRSEEVLGERFERFYPPEEIPRGKAANDLRIAAERGSFEEEGWGVRKDGSRFWAGVLISPILGPAGEILGYGRVVRDLTERRKREQELKESEASLRRSIAELERIVYTVSHDLRSPLRAIQGYSQVLVDRLADRLDPEDRRMLGRIGQAAVRLDRLIRDLLSYHAVAGSEVVLEAVDVDEILAHLTEYYPELANARMTLRSPLGRLRAQPSLLIQALSNLLTNAVKFVPPGRTPEVEVWTERGAEGSVRLVVQDNGIGIPPEAWGRAFQPFERLHTGGEYEGTGIGLAIVRKAVERMGGRVGLSSDPGRGTRFWIDLKEA